ncbi:5423_t:CDS:2, partial [Paraglomus occultum]
SKSTLKLEVFDQDDDGAKQSMGHVSVTIDINGQFPSTYLRRLDSGKLGFSVNKVNS